MGKHSSQTLHPQRRACGPCGAYLLSDRPWEIDASQRQSVAESVVEITYTLALIGLLQLTHLVDICFITICQRLVDEEKHIRQTG